MRLSAISLKASLKWLNIAASSMGSTPSGRVTVCDASVGASLRLMGFSRVPSPYGPPGNSDLDMNMVSSLGGSATIWAVSFSFGRVPPFGITPSSCPSSSIKRWDISATVSLRSWKLSHLGRHAARVGGARCPAPVGVYPSFPLGEHRLTSSSWHRGWPSRPTMISPLLLCST